MIRARVALLPEQLEQLLELKRAAWDAMPDVGSDPVSLAAFMMICDVFRILGIVGDEPAPSGGVDGAGASEQSQRATGTPDGLTHAEDVNDATHRPGGRHRRSGDPGHRWGGRRRDLRPGAAAGDVGAGLAADRPYVLTMRDPDAAV